MPLALPATAWSISVLLRPTTAQSDGRTYRALVRFRAVTEPNKAPSNARAHRRLAYDAGNGRRTHASTDRKDPVSAKVVN
jgi:hypothetical protein